MDDGRAKMWNGHNFSLYLLVTHIPKFGTNSGFHLDLQEGEGEWYTSSDSGSTNTRKADSATPSRRTDSSSRADPTSCGK